jgi:hypothetical protein
MTTLVSRDFIHLDSHQSSAPVSSTSARIRLSLSVVYAVSLSMYLCRLFVSCLSFCLSVFSALLSFCLRLPPDFSHFCSLSLPFSLSQGKPSPWTPCCREGFSRGGVLPCSLSLCASLPLLPLTSLSYLSASLCLSLPVRRWDHKGGRLP